MVSKHFLVLPTLDPGKLSVPKILNLNGIETKEVVVFVVVVVVVLFY